MNLKILNNKATTNSNKVSRFSFKEKAGMVGKEGVGEAFLGACRRGELASVKQILTCLQVVLPGIF